MRWVDLIWVSLSKISLNRIKVHQEELISKFKTSLKSHQPKTNSPITKNLCNLTLLLAIDSSSINSFMIWACLNRSCLYLSHHLHWFISGLGCYPMFLDLIFTTQKRIWGGSSRMAVFISPATLGSTPKSWKVTHQNCFKTWNHLYGHYNSYV